MSLTPNDERAELHADCDRCAGLCCIAPAFSASADFAIDKPAGRPCPNLRGDNRCIIHAELRERGFRGCAVFDCFGAGQHVVQLTFGAQDWRRSPETAAVLFAVFSVVRQLKEALWYLAEAASLVGSGALHDQIEASREQTRTVLGGDPDQLTRFDVATHRRNLGLLLNRVSRVVRERVKDRAGDRQGAELIGAKLAGSDLHGASLRGAYLLGADLRRANLQFADLLGTDLRGADVRGARLADSLFLTQPQLEATTGDRSTSIPIGLSRPRHWPSTATHGTTRRHS
jgi:hypothetical protein